ncbi:MAG: sigma-70 family RNA polymerase sigma factor [Anaerolineae bacterium]|nr:sigma-70 family RNA polymerase sigma factor [Anaerolineae bacterium]
MQPSDEQLVHQARRGNKAAFAELFTRYEGRIFGYLYRMVGERTWAEDLAQEAFIRAHQNLGRLGPPYNFKAWVYRIASNLALDALRRYHYEAPLPDWDGGAATASEPTDQRREGDPEHQARLSEVRAAVWRTLHKLPETYRQILILREFDGLSYREIAVVLSISLDNVRVTLNRARSRFRDLYGLQVLMEEGRLACHELDELLSIYMDGELDRAGRKRVQDHIAVCPACQKKRRDLLALPQLLAVLAPVFPPPTLYTQFLSRLQRLPPPETSPPGGSGSGSPGRGGALKNIRGPGVHRSTIFWWLVGLGGGTLVLLAIAATLTFLLLLHQGVFTIPPNTPPPTPSMMPTDTPTVTSLSLPPTSTLTPTITPVPTSTPMPAPTATPTPTPSPSQTPTDTATPTSAPTHTPTLTATPTSSPIPDTQPPPAPVPVAPVDGVVLSCRSSTILSWNPVSDPSGISGYYVQLRVITFSRATQPQIWGPLTGTQLSVPVSCGPLYRWAVRAEDGAGNPGRWSEEAQFGVGID